MLLQNTKQPLRIFVEDIFPQDVHIAEICCSGFHIFLRSIQIIRVLLANDIQNFLHIVQPMMRRIFIVFPNGFALPKSGDILPFRANDIIVVYEGLNRLFIQSQIFDCLCIKPFIKHIAKSILFQLRRVKAKIAAIMHKAIVICIRVFPRPILRCQLTVHSIFTRDIISRIIVQRIFINNAVYIRSNLNGIDILVF